MKRIFRKDLLSNLKINRKFLVIYIFCVIIPLILTDGLVLSAIFNEEIRNRERDREENAQSCREYIQGIIEYDVLLARALDRNATFYNFITADYETDYDYVSEYASFSNTSFFKTLSSLKSDSIKVYIDNDSILNGDGFYTLSKHRDDVWYQKFTELDVDEALLIYSDDDSLRLNERKKVMFVKRLSYFDGPERYVCVENDVNRLAIELKSLLTDKVSMFIKVNDEFIPFSNVAELNYEAALDRLSRDSRFSSVLEYTYRTTDFKIYTFSKDLVLLDVLAAKMWIIIVLVLITLVIPIIVMNLIERSITSRITELQEAFGGDESGTFLPISNISGSDEFAELMHNYNRIVSINNDLINTVYVDKLHEQENDIARKNAELLALQSQINPHFLFNALESIRMHSMLKGERETAEMIEKLALMERKNCEWGNDSLTIKEEADFIEAYLYLQSYRFGDRLSFDIDIEEECQNILIPKLTLVTFVENACVHGIESKSAQGWIFVRVYQDNKNLYIEVEDTGDGMDEDSVVDMCERMNNVTIESLKKYNRVGILNACLRIRMMFEEDVKFEIESEKGVGLSVLVTIPNERIKRAE